MRTYMTGCRKSFVIVIALTGADREEVSLKKSAPTRRRISLASLLTFVHWDVYPCAFSMAVTTPFDAATFQSCFITEDATACHHHLCLVIVQRIDRA